jgi:quercetin dioxygenase-like cupin family protein
VHGIKDYREFISEHPEKPYKASLFEGQGMLVGINVLANGQIQPAHTHRDQDKFYLVLEGMGAFRLAGEDRQAGPGTVIWAPAGVEHGVSNPFPDLLVLLVGIAPPPGS